jgi:hypothetical protein
MQVNETSYRRSLHEYKEKVEDALAKTKSLRRQVSELILLCEAAKELQ